MKVTTKPTAYGRRIINLLCDRTATKDLYRLAPLDKTPVVVKWLAQQLNKSIKSVAGAVADLVEKGYLNTDWLHFDGRFEYDADKISLTAAGWQQWSKYDATHVAKQWQSDGCTDAEIYDWWANEWDGVDGTMIGMEEELHECGLFATP